MSKNGTIVNEWEKLTALSNRRLNVGESVKMIKMSWSIDRITIVGKLSDNIYYHTSNDVLILNFEQLMRLNEGNGYLKSVSNNSWQLVDQHDENIAYIEILKWQEGKGRIDFNPNK
ncbi:replication protein, partial [Enterococcus faecalis]